MIPELIVIAVGSALATLVLVAVFGAGWYAAGRDHARRDVAARYGQSERQSIDRIHLADLRVRMRRLEGIAAGIDV